MNDHVYSTFKEFYDELVAKLSPDWIRLDGKEKGGNRHIFGKFYHHNKKWRVNSDTHIDQLKKAYEYKNLDPFVEELTNDGKGPGTCLVLNEGLRPKGFKYLYIFELTPKNPR